MISISIGASFHASKTNAAMPIQMLASRSALRPRSLCGSIGLAVSGAGGGLGVAGLRATAVSPCRDAAT